MSMEEVHDKITVGGSGYTRFAVYSRPASKKSRKQWELRGDYARLNTALNRAYGLKDYANRVGICFYRYASEVTLRRKEQPDVEILQMPVEQDLPF